MKVVTKKRTRHTAKQHASKLATLALKERVIDLRKRGATEVQIAKLVDRSPARVCGILKEELQAKEAALEATASELKALELLRLDAWLLALDKRVREGDPRAIDTSLRISERRAKYLGLDAPEKREVSGPRGGPLESKVAFTFDDIDEALKAGDRNVANAASYTNGTHAPHEPPVPTPDAEPPTQQ